MLSKINNWTCFFILAFSFSSYSHSQSVNLSDLRAKYDKKEVYITMRDGVKLFTSIYTPRETSSPHPVLLNRTPYNIEPGGPVNFNFHLLSYSRYTNDNYIMVFQDVRGRYSAKNIHPDVKVPLGGYQMLVRAEVFRGRYRNSFEKPEAFTPSRITEIKYDLPDVAHTFKKGHRIMVQVQNSWFPLVDRNPQKFVDIYHCSDSDFRKATMRIYHDSKYPSHLTVNVLK